jgi:ribonucleotide reductase alpha subunit
MAFEITGGADDATIQKFEQLSIERKRLQEQGLLPSWYTTQAWQMFKQKYAVPGEDAVRGRHRTIAKTLARHMKGREAEWEELFFSEMWDGILSPSSPALANTGTDRGMMVACSGQVIDDSVDGFYTAMRETALLSKWGFGTSADFSGIRPRGTPISKGGKASGAVEVINDFFTTAGKISQGGARRGSIGAYLDIEHGDWDEACDSLAAEPNGKNYGWIIRDSFVEKLKAGDEDANRRWTKALYTKLITGKGYVFCIDKANRHRPQMYKDWGLDIKATNLCCMAADQRVVTDRGIKTVGDLYREGGPNKVVGLTGVDQAGPMLLPRPNAEMVQIETAEGYRHKVTPDHRVWKEGAGWVEAQHLVPGDKLLIQQVEGIFGPEHNPSLAFLAGLIAGDGTFTNNGTSVCIDLWEGKTLHLADEVTQHAAELLASNTLLHTTSTNNPEFVGTSKQRLCSAPLARILAEHGFNADTKLRIPEFVWTGTRETVGQYLRGLYLTDGNIQASKGTCVMSLASVSKEFLQDVQVLWANFGVKSSIAKLHDGGLRDFGENGGVYETRPVWRLLITSIRGCQIADGVTGLSSNREGSVVELFKERLSKKGYAQKMYTTFTGLTKLPNEDAYCLTVDSDTHAWTVNGMITHNTEIMLHSSDDLTYSCILASLNLVHKDKFKQRNSVFIATVFLDCLCQEFIEKSVGVAGLEKVREFTIRGRAIGLGVMGFHTYLQSQGIPYIGLEAQFLSTEIAKHLHDESLRASQWLAQEYGEPMWCEGYGVRNTHRTAYAPTKTTSLLMGGVSESWFPDPGMVFDAGSSVGELRRIPPVFYELMKAKRVYSEQTIQDIIDHLGSVQHVDWLTDEEKLVYLNAFEMDQRILLRHASQRQRYTCQGQSLNFYVPEDGSEDLIAELMTMVLLDENILSQYYIYSRSGIVVKDECVACAA